MFVLHHHVDLTVNVERLMVKLFALVFLLLLVHHLIVGPSVLVMPNVLKTKLVLIKNAKILAPELVVLALLVK